MRLSILSRGHRRPHKVALALLRVIGRGDPDPVLKMVFYRPEFFGGPWMRLVESTMRGPSEWTPAERELFAAFVSRLNACPFCQGVHGGIATLLLRPGADLAALEAWRDRDFDPKLAEAFELLETGRAETASSSRAQLEDALYVGFVFDTVNRLANAFDFQWRDDADRRRLASGLNRARYHVPGFLLR